jgi:hypothetical protein
MKKRDKAAGQLFTRRVKVPQWHWPDELQLIVSFLNEGKHGVLARDEAFREELRTLVREWMKAKRDWSRFLESRLRANKGVAFASGTFYVPAEASTPFMVPLGLDGAGATDAQGQFLRFILNPEAWRLGRRPCKRCGRYFLRAKRTEEKIFCDHRCASGNSAAESMRAKRKKAHEDIVKEASAAMARWSALSEGEQAKHRSDKAYIAQSLKKYRVGEKWVTRNMDEVRQSEPEQGMVV